jgi:peptide-methionine (S)-S-oxide reductase
MCTARDSVQNSRASSAGETIAMALWSLFSLGRKDGTASATNNPSESTEGAAAMHARAIPPTEVPAGKEVATLAGGCFWCLEAVYDDLAGVESVESGYMGGQSQAPTYEEVCGGDSVHAEVVRVTFDPAQISYRDILDVFFVIHDPTTLNRQGNDVGTQYRSAIFYHSPEQNKVAAEAIAHLQAEKVYDDPIVTEVTPASEFWMAERYHQEYFKNNPYQPYCMWVVAPKVQKFRKQFLAKAKKA